ncbi:MAG: hypothetical protein PWQ08_948 [Clostridiales bacterium]|jgi:Na+/H+-dicarboxylate symporter|nr:hypothetical protein [Clostridiales bacterium]MDK2935697.1 hypothetical protein [Eubacteriaceae bacterium]
MKQTKVHAHSIGIFGVITAVLAALKLAGLVHFSWLLVIAPLLLGIVIQIVIFLLALLWIKWHNGRKYKR